MEKVFINTAFTKAIDDYMNSSDNVRGVLYNSFLVVVIRMLISIYSELDIINPKMAEDANMLKENLAKFGYLRTNIDSFLDNVQLFYDFELKRKSNNSIKNPYFITIQKNLIDMLIAKKLNFYLTELDVKKFYELLYTPFAPDPLRVSYNFLMADKVLEIDEYFKRQMSENVKLVLPQEKHFLNIKAYELLNYSMDDLRNLDGSEIDKINTQVYDYFKIRENAINKEYLLEKAIEAMERENDKVTSGNGYVDILIVLSVICTVAMLVGILAFIFI